MATISITIPAGVLNRVLDAVAAECGWVNEEISGTKAVFAKAQVIKWVKGLVKNYESRTASNAARASAIEAVDDEVNIT